MDRASLVTLLRACTLVAGASCLVACHRSAWCPVGRDWGEHEVDDNASEDACWSHPTTAPRAADRLLLDDPLGCGAEREPCLQRADETPRAFADRLWAEGNRVGPRHPVLAVTYYRASLSVAPDATRASYVQDVLAELDRPFVWVAASPPPAAVYSSVDELCDALGGDARSRCHLASGWRLAKQSDGESRGYAIAQLRVGRMSDFGATHYLLAASGDEVWPLLVLGEEGEATRSPDLEHLSVELTQWPLVLGEQLGVVWASMPSDERGCARPLTRTLARCDLSGVPRCTEVVELGPMTEWPPQSMPREPAAAEACLGPASIAQLGEGTPRAASYAAQFSVEVTASQLVATRSWDGWRACARLEARPPRTAQTHGP
ncbi:MAG: hypothetical protein H6726_11580 [Sandaracinaceae bacterium]|nr:hypothetical protein [Sandaracinaceae bacterium]